ncbi:TetR/AcrR family transcriptional regulator [Novosphingobium sp.]|uniref:TetR/AcrR family transcriptional regulator n=1 Tax=Novosphingobium sp. TaxID=1874826 RepID=UPI002734A0F7|nr:TetR/AcrR family transcriptional regulator [Novosphingobium sp.]MDP3907554.1 TetR/AcrR family transcriptional regulator [Novosphingobium sp.]
MTEPLLSPRAARTRSALLSAGMELMVDRPVDAIAIDEFVASARVAKGSFFNHFKDKREYANAIAREIRTEIEYWVGTINSGITDPLERLAGGMIAAAAYALARPQRTVVLARSFNGLSLGDHPINAGLLRDLRDAANQGQIHIPSEQAGVLYWLGSCQTLMGGIVEGAAGHEAVEALLMQMLELGLRGLGADPAQIARAAGPPTVKGRFASLEGAPRQ